MLGLQFIGVAAPRPRRPRVLVAEDHPLLRRAIRVALERDGYDVLEAGNGLELVDRLQETTLAGEPAPDLVLSDQGLPLATGLEVLGRLREAQWPLPFVLMLDGPLDGRLEADAYRLGARAVLAKPFGLEQLRATVRAALALPAEEVPA
ncbi:MAG: response regulator [Planctomycetota bacterium]|nr:response regulator [Planctomycetota bacterium]